VEQAEWLANIYSIEPQKESNLCYRISRNLYLLIKLMGSNTSITSVELAQSNFSAEITKSSIRKQSMLRSC
jgi:hypothetical protein